MSLALRTLLLLSVLSFPALAQSWNESSWTLDEQPSATQPVQPQPLLDVPDSMTHLFPFLREILQDVSQGRARGDAGSLLEAVRQLSRILDLGGIGGDAIATDAVLDEAAEIAWQQRDPIALRDSLALYAAPIRAGRSQDKIEQTRERIEQVEQERADMLNRKRCSLVFHNRTDQPVEIFINRKPVGTLQAGSKRVVSDLLAGRQHLIARQPSLQWGPRQVYVGPGEVFNWRLFD